MADANPQPLSWYIPGSQGKGNCKEPQKTAPEIPMMNGSQKSPVFYLVNRGCERLHSKSGSIYFRGEYEIGEKKGS